MKPWRLSGPPGLTQVDRELQTCVSEGPDVKQHQKFQKKAKFLGYRKREIVSPLRPPSPSRPPPSPWGTTTNEIVRWAPQVMVSRSFNDVEFAHHAQTSLALDRHASFGTSMPKPCSTNKYTTEHTCLGCFLTAQNMQRRGWPDGSLFGIKSVPMQTQISQKKNSTSSSIAFTTSTLDVSIVISYSKGRSRNLLWVLSHGSTECVVRMHSYGSVHAVLKCAFAPTIQTLAP